MPISVFRETKYTSMRKEIILMIPICFLYRMRNATILVFRLKGVATETIKNIVLAGIGKLVVVDHEDVTEEDLGASFFFRDEDVGKKVRVY